MVRPELFRFLVPRIMDQRTPAWANFTLEINFRTIRGRARDLLTLAAELLDEIQEPTWRWGYSPRERRKI